MSSLPSWERGLKSSYVLQPLLTLGVAPLVGAWIEIVSASAGGLGVIGRSPRGSVD